MRVALLSPLPPEQNGIADYASHFKEALQGAGVEVLSPFQQGTPLSSVDWQNVDLVHAEIGGGRIREFEAVQWLQQQSNHPPITMTVHDPERLIWKPLHLPFKLDRLQNISKSLHQAAILLCDPWTLKTEKKLAQQCDRLITLTQTGGTALVQRMGLKPQQNVVIPHGNGVIPYQPPPNAAVLKLLYFGFIYRGKGIETLLDALSQVLLKDKNAVTQVHLTIAGGTAPEMAFGHDNYLAQLQQQIQEQDLGRVTSLSVDVPSDRIPELIQSHDWMVLPYRESQKLSWLGQQRGTSGALSWANACGRPVIASNARAFQEEVSHGNGLVFQQGDASALADCIQTVLQNRALTNSCAQAAQQMGVQRQWRDTALKFKAMWSEVIASTSSSPSI